MTTIPETAACCDFCSSPLRTVPGLEQHGCAQCADCGCVVVLPRPSSTEVTTQYEMPDYYTLRCSPNELAEGVVSHRALARRLRRETRPGARVLEVGCAAGALLAALRDAGFQASGIDVSAAAVAQARSVLGVDAAHASVEEYEFPRNVDAIVALHVIEHLVRPSTLLEKASRAVRPGGIVVLEVPDYGARMRHQLGTQWPYFLPGEHLQHFDEPCLRQVCARYGLRPYRAQRLGGLGLLQPGQGHEGVAAAHETVQPPGWRRTLYGARHVVYRIPGARWSVRALNNAIGYRLMHRNAYLRVWARRR